MGTKLCTSCDCNKTEQAVELDLQSHSASQFATERMTTRESSVALQSDKRPARLPSVQAVEKIRRIQAVWRGHQERKQFVHIRKQAAADYPYFSQAEVKETLDRQITSVNGEFIYSTGARYLGQWLGGFRHGSGSMLWPDGAQYEGQWHYGRPHGRGTFTHINGEQFLGLWTAAEKDGYAWLAKKTQELRTKKPLDDSAQRLEAELAEMRIRLDGMQAVIEKLKSALGKGVQPMGDGRAQRQVRYPTGITYEGEMADELRDGRGKTTWTNGDTYEGDWKADMQNGYGRNVWADGSEFHGQYQDNLKQGVGLYTWEDGSQYLGEWRGDKMTGVGRYVWPQGKVYTGQWLAGVFHGLGELSMPSGKRFIGSWQNGKKHGVGVTLHADGSASLEHWMRGKCE